MSGGLAEFLLARIAEIEALARAGAGGWYVGDAWVPFAWGTELDVNFAWLLAECEAKRRIVTEQGHGEEHMCYQNGRDGNTWDNYDGDCPIMLALALPYADHPDFREEWRL